MKRLHSIAFFHARRNSLGLALSVLSAMFVTACGDVNKQPEFVVVDVISVAGALGRDDLIQKQVEDANAQLNQQLAQIKTSLEQQFQQEESRLNQSRSESDKEKVKELLQETQLKLRQSQLLAKQKSEEYRSGLLIEFRNEILDAAKEIAKEKKALSIRVANNDLLWYDESVDITTEVIKALRAKDKNPEADKAAKQESAPKSDSSETEKQSVAAEQVEQLNQVMETIGQEDPTKASKPDAADGKAESPTP